MTTTEKYAEKKTLIEAFLPSDVALLLFASCSKDQLCPSLFNRFVVDADDVLVSTDRNRMAVCRPDSVDLQPGTYEFVGKPMPERGTHEAKCVLNQIDHASGWPFPKWQKACPSDAWQNIGFYFNRRLRPAQVQLQTESVLCLDLTLLPPMPADWKLYARENEEKYRGGRTYLYRFDADLRMGQVQYYLNAMGFRKWEGRP